MSEVIDCASKIHKLYLRWMSYDHSEKKHHNEMIRLAKIIESARYSENSQEYKDIIRSHEHSVERWEHFQRMKQNCEKAISTLLQGEE